LSTPSAFHQYGGDRGDIIKAVAPNLVMLLSRRATGERPLVSSPRWCRPRPVLRV